MKVLTFKREIQKELQFEFVSLPQWVYDIWETACPYSVEHATIEQEEDNA